MKKYILAIFFLFIIGTGFANDLTIDRNNSSSNDTTIIFSSDDFPLDSEMYKALRSLTRRKFEPHWAGFEMGFNCYGKSNFSTSVPSEYNQMEQNVENSLAYNLNIFDIGKSLGSNNFGILTGIGLSWNNYHFDDKATILYTANHQLYAIHDSVVTNSYRKSKLNIMWLRIPLMFEWQNGKDEFTKAIYFSAGVVGSVKLGAHTKQKYDDNITGSTTKLKSYDNFYLEPFKVDLEAHIGLGPIRIFVNYGLTQMFQKDKGPELYPWTVGLTLINL